MVYTACILSHYTIILIFRKKCLGFPTCEKDRAALVGLVQDVIEFREPQPESSQGQERAPEGWTPDIGANAVVGEISRRELSGAADATVAIFPSREDGIPFLKDVS